MKAGLSKESDAKCRHHVERPPKDKWHQRAKELPVSKKLRLSKRNGTRMHPSEIRLHVLRLMLQQQRTEDLNEIAGLEFQMIDACKQLEALYDLPWEWFLERIEKQYPDWVQNLPKDEQPPI